MKTFIDFIYTVSIGLATAFLIGFGIWAFTTAPKYPEYPGSPAYPTAPYYPAYTYTYEEQLAQSEKQRVYEEELKTYEKESARINDEYSKKVEAYDKQEKNYKKRIATIAVMSGVISYLFGMIMFRKNSVIGEGFALGGMFALGYAASLFIYVQSKRAVFGIVAGLLLMLILLVLQRAGLRLNKLRIKS